LTELPNHEVVGHTHHRGIPEMESSIAPLLDVENGGAAISSQPSAFSLST